MSGRSLVFNQFVPNCCLFCDIITDNFQVSIDLVVPYKSNSVNDPSKGPVLGPLNRSDRIKFRNDKVTITNNRNETLTKCCH